MKKRVGGRRGTRAAALVSLVLALGVAPASAGDPSPKRLGKAIDAIVSRPDFAAASRLRRARKGWRRSMGRWPPSRIAHPTNGTSDSDLL